MRGTRIWIGRLFVCTFCVIAVAGAFHRVYADDPVIIPVVTYSSDVHISEFLPDPVGSDSELEFIELHNSSSESVDLSGWSLSNASGKVFSIPANVGVPPGDYVVFYSAESGSLLANTGERIVRLVDPGHVVHEEAIYNGSKEGRSYNRASTGTYEESSTPTPGAENVLDVAPTPSLLPSTSPIPSVSTAPDPALVPVYANTVRINEFLPNPAGSDVDFEFIELYNSSADAIDLSDWVIDTGGSSHFALDAGTTIEPHGFIVFYSSDFSLSLSNSSDHVILLSPDGEVRDSAEYSSSKEGYSYNRVESGDFLQSYRLTPGGENSIENPTPTPKVTPTPKPTTDPVVYDFSTRLIINELYPTPKKGDKEDEFVEVKNEENRIVYLSGWSIDDSEGGSRPYRFKDSDSIGPHAIIVLRKIDTHIAFNNDYDSVRLLNPDGKVVAQVKYEKPKTGQSLNRAADGTYVWSDAITPGKENIIRVQEETVTRKPSPKSSRKILPRVSGSVNKRTGGILGATTLPWPTILPAMQTVQTVTGSATSSGSQRVRETLFGLFGGSIACVQLVSGIARKEKIWSMGK